VWPCLGPRQPLPHTLAFCRACGIWINNEGQAQPQHISSVLAKVMAGLAASRGRRTSKKSQKAAPIKK